MRTTYWEKNLYELIRRTSISLPKDVENALKRGRRLEAAGSSAQWAIDSMLSNAQQARAEERPLCSDTGTLIFYCRVPAGIDTNALSASIRAAVARATRDGYLRQNTVDAISGAKYRTNVAHASPVILFQHGARKTVDVRLVMKSASSENEGRQYSLPDHDLGAGADLEGFRDCILDAVLQSQTNGGGPAILGVCIGGDRATGYAHSKVQFLHKLGYTTRVKALGRLENAVLRDSRKLDIGPMGLGGKSALLDVHIGSLSRLPSSVFVSVSYMCWAFRRRGAVFGPGGGLKHWLY
jgi:fumarate hydratase class I